MTVAPYIWRIALAGRSDSYGWEKQNDWPLQYFRPQELACKGTGALIVHAQSGARLDSFRALLGRPCSVVSGYRSRAHNKNVGGAPNSYHLKGRAFDIAYDNAEVGWEMLDAARRVGFTGLGFYKTFLHLDTGPPRLWVG